MTIYATLKFLHVVGALGVFAALGLEWAGVWQLRHATTAEQVKEWGKLFAVLRRLGPASLGTLLLSGLYLTATAWRAGPAWIIVGLVTLFLMPPLGALSGQRVAGILRAAAPDQGLLSEALRQRLRDPVLVTSLQTRATMLLGIVFLMTAKPGLGGTLLTMGTAIVLGLASALPAWAGGGRRGVAT